MSNNPKKAVWDPCLDEPMESNPKVVKSMVNKKYMENLPAMRRQIERNNTENNVAVNESLKWIIK